MALVMSKPDRLFEIWQPCFFAEKETSKNVKKLLRCVCLNFCRKLLSRFYLRRRKFDEFESFCSPVKILFKFLMREIEVATKIWFRCFVSIELASKKMLPIFFTSLAFFWVRWMVRAKFLFFLSFLLFPSSVLWRQQRNGPVERGASNRCLTFSLSLPLSHSLVSTFEPNVAVLQHFLKKKSKGGSKI